MPRRKQTITRIIDDDPEPAVNAVPEPDGADEELHGFFSRFPGRNRAVVYRFGERGRGLGYVGTVYDLNSLDEEFLASEYGPGRYTISIRDDTGKPVGNKTLTIHERNPARAVPAPAGADEATRIQIEMLRDTLARQQDLLHRMLERPAGGGSMTEMIGALAQLQAAQPKPADIGSALTAAIEAFSRGAEIGAMAGTEGESKLGWLTLAKEVIAELPRILPGLAARAGAPRAPALGPGMTGALQSSVGGSTAGAPVLPPLPPAQMAAEGAVPSGPGEMPVMDASALALLRQGIDYLKRKCLGGKDPELWAEMLADSADEAPWTSVVSALSNWSYDDFARVDPELQSEPYRTWFLTLYESLRVLIFKPEAIAAAEPEVLQDAIPGGVHTSRRGGNAGDTAGNDGAGARSATRGKRKTRGAGAAVNVAH